MLKLVCRPMLHKYVPTKRNRFTTDFEGITDPQRTRSVFVRYHVFSEKPQSPRAAPSAFLPSTEVRK